ncbi:MAG TPA: hypothetical protein VHV30_13075 [Polyangiaceae bacterium]|nr:hypothetical protein [Polyangiaceae bacterium]
MALTPACGLDVNGELFVGDEAGTSGPSGNADGGSASSDDEDGGTGFMSGSSGGGLVPPSGDDGGPGGSGGDDGGPGCNYAGHWATKITIPVMWAPQGLTSVILASGAGTIEQWIVSDRTVNGLATTEAAHVCGITLPDFQSTGFVGGGETYGIRFPDALFDSGDIPTVTINGKLGDRSPSASFVTQANAVLIGLTLGNATTAPWPALITSSVDTDKDGNPGVTANVASGPVANSVTGAMYSAIPTDVDFNRATQVFVAIRQVTALTGTAIDCDHIAGTVTIPNIPVPATAAAAATTKYAIDSHVLGCALGDGGACSISQTAFVDGTEPVFTPTSGGTFTSARMNSADCASVRRAYP